MDDDSDDDFSGISLPPEAPGPAAPAPLEFQPWHKPRKQYVRVNQWMRYIQGIVRKLQQGEAFADGDPLRYLTLPGPDLLDIRMLADYCATQDIRLKYTGFCYADNSEEQRLRQNVSEFSLTHKQAIATNSKVVRQRLQEISTRNSEASLELEKGGPFDVINIDACDPLAVGEADASGRLVDTIRRLTEYQLSNRRKPWLLLLTTPVQTDSISTGSLAALHGEVVANTQRDAQFATELSAKFEQGESVQEFLTRLSKQNGGELLSVFALGLSKWLIHLAEQANFKVIKLDGYCYSMYQRTPYAPNMVSLSFEFEPVPIAISDDTGLTPNTPPVVQTTLPVPSHLRALRRSFSIQNVDEFLLANSAANDEMASQTKALLGAVGYDVDHVTLGYDAWVRQQSQLPDEPGQVA